jgi:hypothetical protein
LAVLEDANYALRPLEVRQRVEQRLGQHIEPHTVVASLSSGAKNPKVLIVRVSPGRYRIDKAACSPTAGARGGKFENCL